MLDFIIIVALIVVAIRLATLSSRIQDLEKQNRELRRWIDRVWERVRTLPREEWRARAEEHREEPAAATEATPDAASEPEIAPGAGPPAEAPTPVPAGGGAEEVASPAPEIVPEPVEEPVPEPVAAREDVSPLPSAAQPAAAPLPPRKPFDFESLVGVKLFSWLAGIALVFAAIFFLRYSIDSGWMTPPVRASIGLLTGIGILAFTSIRFSRAYPITANALEGAAVAVLYATVWASSVLWSLIGSATAVAAMALITIVAVVLSVRRESLFIALLGMLGGFATPALFATGEDRTTALFSYLLILNGGLAWTAYRRKWPSLMAASMIFTTLYQLAWAANFLDASRMPAAAAIFLAFPALFSVFHLSSARKDEPAPLYGKALVFAGIVPLLFAIYSAAVPEFGSRFHLLFAFLLIAVVGFGLLSVTLRNAPLTGGVPAVATIVVFAIWLARGWVPAAWPTVLIWISAFVLLFAFGPILLRRLGTNPLIERSTTVAPLLLFAFPAVIALAPETRAPLLVFTVGALLLVVCAVSAHLTGRASDYGTAAFAMLVSQAFWSGEHLDATNTTAGAILYGTFALLMIVIGTVARRTARGDVATHSPWLLLGSFVLALFLVQRSIIENAFVAMTGLVVALFVAVAAESIRARKPLLFRGGIVAAFIVIGAAFLQVPPGRLVDASLALAAAVGVGALVTAAIGARRELRVAGVAAPAVIENAYYAIGAYIFLMAAAASPRIPDPASMILPVLGVVTVALTLAAFHFRRVSLHAAGIAGALLVLLELEVVRFATHSTAAPVLGGAAVALFAIVAMLAAKRFLFRGERLDSGDSGLAVWIVVAFGASVALQFLASAAVAAPHTLPSGVLLTLLSAAALAIALICGASRWHPATLLGVATTAITLFVFRESGDRGPLDAGTLAAATVQYLTFTLYGFWFALRAARDHRAQLVAAAASVPFFFLFRDAFEASRLEAVIGVLPLAIAAVLLLLLTRVPREKDAETAHHSTRALLAAAVLAYATVAVPLQLDNEWLTLGWALEAAALAWLYTRIPHRNLPYWSAALFAAVFVRLVLNPAVFAYHERSGTPILNWYLYTYLVAAAAFFAGGWLWQRVAKEHPLSGLRPLLNGSATALLFLLLNIEIADFYSTGKALTFDFFRSSLAQELTYTLGWAVFAIGLLVAGIFFETRSARIAAIALLSVTVFKGFLHDLSRLGGLYRVASFVGLAISLSVVAVLLQKFALKRGEVAERAGTV